MTKVSSPQISKWQIICTIVLGLATVASFLYQHTTGFFDLANIGRILLVVALLVSLFASLHGIPDKSTSMPKYAKTLVWLLPSLAVLCAVINTIWPELGHALVKGGHVFSFRPAIYVKMLLDLVSCVVFIVLVVLAFVGYFRWRKDLVGEVAG